MPTGTTAVLSNYLAMIQYSILNPTTSSSNTLDYLWSQVPNKTSSQQSQSYSIYESTICLSLGPIFWTGTVSGTPLYDFNTMWGITVYAGNLVSTLTKFITAYMNISNLYNIYKGLVNWECANNNSTKTNYSTWSLAHTYLLSIINDTITPSKNPNYHLVTGYSYPFSGGKISKSRKDMKNKIKKFIKKTHIGGDIIQNAGVSCPTYNANTCSANDPPLNATYDCIDTIINWLVDCKGLYDTASQNQYIATNYNFHPLYPNYVNRFIATSIVQKANGTYSAYILVDGSGNYTIISAVDVATTPGIVTNPIAETDDLNNIILRTKNVAPISGLSGSCPPSPACAPAPACPILTTIPPPFVAVTQITSPTSVTLSFLVQNGETAYKITSSSANKYIIPTTAAGTIFTSVITIIANDILIVSATHDSLSTIPSPPSQSDLNGLIYGSSASEIKKLPIDTTNMPKISSVFISSYNATNGYVKLGIESSTTNKGKSFKVDAYSGTTGNYAFSFTKSFLNLTTNVADMGTVNSFANIPYAIVVTPYYLTSAITSTSLVGAAYILTVDLSLPEPNVVITSATTSIINCTMYNSGSEKQYIVNVYDSANTFLTTKSSSTITSPSSNLATPITTASYAIGSYTIVQPIIVVVTSTKDATPLPTSYFGLPSVNRIDTTIIAPTVATTAGYYTSNVAINLGITPTTSLRLTLRPPTGIKGYQISYGQYTEYFTTASSNQTWVSATSNSINTIPNYATSSGFPMYISGTSNTSVNNSSIYGLITTFTIKPGAASNWPLPPITPTFSGGTTENIKIGWTDASTNDGITHPATTYYKVALSNTNSGIQSYTYVKNSNSASYTASTILTCEDSNAYNVTIYPTCDIKNTIDGSDLTYSTSYTQIPLHVLYNTGKSITATAKGSNIYMGTGTTTAPASGSLTKYSTAPIGHTPLTPLYYFSRIGISASGTAGTTYSLIMSNANPSNFLLFDSASSATKAIPIMSSAVNTGPIVAFTVGATTNVGYSVTGLTGNLAVTAASPGSGYTITEYTAFGGKRTRNRTKRLSRITTHRIKRLSRKRKYK